MTSMVTVEAHNGDVEIRIMHRGDVVADRITVPDGGKIMVCIWGDRWVDCREVPVKGKDDDAEAQ